MLWTDRFEEELLESENDRLMEGISSKVSSLRHVRVTTDQLYFLLQPSYNIMSYVCQLHQPIDVKVALSLSLSLSLLLCSFATSTFSDSAGLEKRGQGAGHCGGKLCECVVCLPVYCFVFQSIHSPSSTTSHNYNYCCAHNTLVCTR